MKRARATLSAIVLSLAMVGCTDRLVGFRAQYASNTVAVRPAAPQPDWLVMQVPKSLADAQGGSLLVAPHRAVLHLDGYLPMKAERVTESGESYELLVAVPPDLVKAASRSAAQRVQVSGELYLPIETVVVSFAGVERRVPAPTRNISVTVEAVYSGPMTSAAAQVGEFLRGLYSAR